MAKLPPGLVPRLLSREAAAFYCGMSRNHFAAYIEPAVTARAFGGKRLWDRHELDRWLDSGTPLGQPAPSIKGLLSGA